MSEVITSARRTPFQWRQVGREELQYERVFLAQMNEARHNSPGITNWNGKQCSPAASVPVEEEIKPVGDVWRCATIVKKNFWACFGAPMGLFHQNIYGILLYWIKAGNEIHLSWRKKTTKCAAGLLSAVYSETDVTFSRLGLTHSSILHFVLDIQTQPPAKFSLQA